MQNTCQIFTNNLPAYTGTHMNSAHHFKVSSLQGLCFRLSHCFPWCFLMHLAAFATFHSMCFENGINWRGHVSKEKVSGPFLVRAYQLMVSLFKHRVQYKYCKGLQMTTQCQKKTQSFMLSSKVSLGYWNNHILTLQRRRPSLQKDQTGASLAAIWKASADAAALSCVVRMISLTMKYIENLDSNVKSMEIHRLL